MEKIAKKKCFDYSVQVHCIYGILTYVDELGQMSTFCTVRRQKQQVMLF